MERRRLWRGAKEVLRLGLVLLIVTTEIVSLVPGSTASIAEASVAADKKDEKHQKERNEKKRRDDDRGDDFVLNGQVLAIDTHKEPPELVVGTVDGNATVRVLKTDEIAINGVGVGDYVELTGEKVNELLFEATQISVGERFAGSSPPASEPHESETVDEAGRDESDEESGPR